MEYPHWWLFVGIPAAGESLVARSLALEGRSASLTTAWKLHGIWNVASLHQTRTQLVFLMGWILGWQELASGAISVEWKPLLISSVICVEWRPLLISGVIWGIVHTLDPATPSACSYILTMSMHVATDSVTMTRSLICNMHLKYSKGLCHSDNSFLATDKSPPPPTHTHTHKHTQVFRKLASQRSLQSHCRGFS